MLDPRRASIVTVLAALTVTYSLSAAADNDPCRMRVQEGTSSSRTVVLAGGNAWELFQKYLDEAQKNKVKLSLWGGVKVVANDGTGRKEFSTEKMEMLSMEGSKERWKKKLAAVKSVVDPALLEEADRMKWDMICQGGLPSPRKNALHATGEGIPLEARMHFQQGMQYAGRRDFVNAGKEFTNAIQKHPTYAAAFSNRGVVFMQQKKFDLAEDDLKKAVELEPRDGKNHYNLACWYSLQNQAGRGVASIDLALANGFTDYKALRRDKDLANLRKAPDWQKILDKHKVFIGSGR